VNVRLSKAVFSSDKNSRGQLTLASSGGKAILSPSRGYTKSTPFGVDLLMILEDITRYQLIVAL
jgi:hypothetical protein